LTAPRALLAVALSALALGGCGSSAGLGENAVVAVYAAADSCAGAREVAGAGKGRAGEARVEVRCLPRVERGGRIDLAAVGANARRAVEDSTTVAYLGERDASAAEFSRTILEEAGIAQLSGMSGRVAMARLLAAIRAADLDSGTLREQVLDELR
jgi:hypothetical protein